MSTPRSHRPNATLSRAVIGVSILFAAIFVADQLTGFGLPRYFALVPQDLVAALEVLREDPGAADAWLTVGTVFSTVLVHADLQHVGFNILYFWFFGTLLAQLTRDRWVLLALLVCSLTSALAFVIHHIDGPRSPVIGASGAISGVAGFYVLLAFRWDAPSVMAWPLARPVPAPQAAILAVVFTLLDIWVLSSGGGGGVAQDAHIGGFAGGLLLGGVLTTVFPTWERFHASHARAEMP